MKNTIKLIAVTALLSFLLFSCGSMEETDLPVSGLSISKIVTSTSADTSQPPISYAATISWGIDDIEANEVAAASLTGFEVAMVYGTSKEQVKELDADATEYTFTGLKPGEYCWLNVTAIYDTTANPDAEDSSDVSKSVKFLGGPWIESTTSKIPANTSRFSVGSFNHLDSMPCSFSSADDVYYFNYYNEDYQFENVGDVVWLIVDVAEVTTANDTDTQRNNVMWLNDDFQLLDKSYSGLTSYDDIAGVDVKILDIYGNEVLSISGSSTEGTVSNLSSFISSVDSGYYADITGYYFIKATCTSMPSTYSADNDLGIWGFANNGPRR